MPSTDFSPSAEGQRALRALEQNRRACTTSAPVHAFVVGELACGKRCLNWRWPPTRKCCFFMDAHALMGRGIGYADMHLLAATRLGAHSLWTRDKQLHTIAAQLGLAHVEARH